MFEVQQKWFYPSAIIYIYKFSYKVTGKMAFDIKVPTKQKSVIEFFYTEKIAPLDFYRHLIYSGWE